MQTNAAKNILMKVEAALEAACVSSPETMIASILAEAQSFADQGYTWDVALAKACQIYPATKACGRYVYEK